MILQGVQAHYRQAYNWKPLTGSWSQSKRLHWAEQWPGAKQSRGHQRHDPRYRHL